MSSRALPATGHVIALPTGRMPRRLAETQVVPVAEAVSALTFDLGPDAPLSGRLRGEIDSAPITGPLVSTALALRSGGVRHVLLVGAPSGALLDRRVMLSLGGHPAAAIDPDWLQSPLADGNALIEGLAEDGRRRLLKLFLTTGASLFGAGAAAAFAKAASDLLALLGVRALAPVSSCRLGAAAVLSYPVPATFDTSMLGDLVLLGRGRTRRLTGVKPAVERQGKAALLHLLLPPLPAGAALVTTGPAPMRLDPPDGGTAAEPLGRWLAGRDAATRIWAGDLVEAAAASDPAAAALAHETRWIASAPPALEVAHLSATPRGILYAVRLRDPRSLVRGLRLERGGAAVEVTLDHRPGGACVGYAPLPAATRLDDAARLRLVFRSGRVETVHQGPLAAFDGTLPAEAGADDARAVARARLDRERVPVNAWIEDFGEMPRRPRLVVVADLAPDLDLVRARAAMIAAEAGSGGVALVCTAPDGPLAVAARSAIAQAVAVHGLPHRLVVTGGGAGEGDRLVAALGQIEAAATLVLGAAVLPERGTGLVRGLRRLSATRPVLAGTLTDHEGQEAGAGVAACVALAPAAVAAIRDAGPVYPDAHVLVADAARRLGAAGRPGVAGRFIRYAAPAPVDPAEAAVDAWALRLLAGETGEEPA